jgi:hypothetical protein
MKAEELRIGNWAMRDTQPEGFQIDEYSFARLINRHHQYNPIPLTDEWFDKFGFKGNELTAAHNRLVRFGDHIGISGMLGVVKPVECKYVHQLQNLYFALTGEELTIINQ